MVVERRRSGSRGMSFSNLYSSKQGMARHSGKHYERLGSEHRLQKVSRYKGDRHSLDV